MKSENELAMVVAFYLSKFGEIGLTSLGYKTYRQAFDDVGQRLNVKPSSVKNWRDEFDPFYDNQRKGWYQRGIRPSRQKVMDVFDDLSESGLRAIVLDILNPESQPALKDELSPTLREIEAINYKKKTPREYVPRGPTGRMAEEVFISQFRAGLTPFAGILNDRRDDGAGFDFEIIDPEREPTVVEIKGLAKELGGITFTDKEWRVANEREDCYYLGLVTDLLVLPKIGFLQNPASVFDPAYYIYTTVSIHWSVSAEQVSQIHLSPSG